MSWSRTAYGTPASIIDRVEEWQAAQDADDRAKGLDDGVRIGQREQIIRVVEAVKAFADRCLDGSQVTVSAGGSAVGPIGNWYVNLGTYIPVPVQP